MGHQCEAGEPHCFTAVSHFDVWITENSGVVPSASDSNSTENFTAAPGNSTPPGNSIPPGNSTRPGNSNSKILDLVKDLLAKIMPRK